MKYLIIGFVIYLVYKYMNPPALQEPIQQQKIYEDDLDTRNKSKNPRGEEEDYIDYEEVE